MPFRARKTAGSKPRANLRCYSLVFFCRYSTEMKLTTLVTFFLLFDVITALKLGGKTGLGEAKNGMHKKYSLCEIVIFVNNTLIIFHFLCQSSSHYVLSSSTKNDPNLQKSIDVFASHLVHTFDV